MQESERGERLESGARDAAVAAMTGKNGSVLFLVLSLGCSVASEPAQQQRGLEGAGVPPTPENPEPEDPGEEPSCEPAKPRAVEGWATYRNGHYSFRAPRSLFFAPISVNARVELTSSFEGNTDPAVSKYFAESIVEQNEGLAAWYFQVRVSELHAPGSPEDRLTALAAEPQGLPPPGREHNHECGITESRELIYACLPAVDGEKACNTIRGYSYEWTRFVYTADRVFEMTCLGAAIVEDKAEVCARVLDSLVVD